MHSESLAFRRYTQKEKERIQGTFRLSLKPEVLPTFRLAAGRFPLGSVLLPCERLHNNPLTPDAYARGLRSGWFLSRFLPLRASMYKTGPKNRNCQSKRKRLQSNLDFPFFRPCPCQFQDAETQHFILPAYSKSSGGSLNSKESSTFRSVSKPMERISSSRSEWRCP